MMRRMADPIFPRSSGIVGLLLAAGQGSRFRAATGRDKLTEPIPEGLPGAGTPVILASMRNLAAAVDEALAVVDEDRPERAALLRDAGYAVLSCRSKGTGQSVALGVAARPDAKGWVIALADMPFIAPATIRAVASALAEHDLAAPVQDRRRAHPVGFAAIHRPALLQLRGDSGGRSILAAGTLHLVPVDDPGSLIDIDHPDDWAAMPGASPASP